MARCYHEVRGDGKAQENNANNLLRAVALISAEGWKTVENVISLPRPETGGTVSVEEALHRRRSRRSFQPRALTLKHLSQLLWAAGAAPSAGATYPLDIFVVVGRSCVEKLEPGVYQYLGEQSLGLHAEGDQRVPLSRAAFRQDFVAQAPISLVIAATYERTTGRYGKRGQRYVDIEVGHVGENVYLQAEAIGLGTVAVGAFEDNAVARVVELPSSMIPLYIMPVGYVAV
jgi:SagB-type dehydrogenase family enzyme